MSETLVKYVVDADTDRLLALTLEDLALCQAWYASYMDMPNMLSDYETLPAKVAQWTSDKSEPGILTNGARQQPLLRSVLERLEKSGPGLLARDELDFIFFVYELIQRTKNRNQFQRPLELIAPHMRDITSRREVTQPVRGLPAVLKHVGVATETSILEATRRTIAAFGGLPIEFRGPVLRHGGGLKVIGDIPDGTAVVVEGDACYVSGYVLGKLLVRGHIEVHGNVSGLVISQTGNIRARGIVNRAGVVAKLGRIRAGIADGPDLVYAGTQIRIDERARLGRYLAPRIRVDGGLYGGECHVTTLLKSPNFSQTDHQPLDIILRSELGCEDYGEIVPKEARLLSRSAIRLRNRIDHIHQLMSVQQEEAEHYAMTALMYICSGSESRKELLAADGLKRRRAFLIRMLTGVHLLTQNLTERLAEFRKRGDRGVSAKMIAERSVQSVLNEVSRELAQLKIEGDFPVELDQEWADLVALHTASARNDSEGVLSGAILRFHEARKAWRTELESLDAQVGLLQDQLSRDATRKSLLERAQADGTSQTTLAQLIRAARQRGASDPVMQRVGTPFIKRMLTLLQKRNLWVERYHKEAGELRAELTELQRQLVEEYSVSPSNPVSDTKVEGCFTAGIHLYVGEKHSLPANGGRVTAVETPDTGTASWTFQLRDGEISRIVEE